MHCSMKEHGEDFVIYYQQVKLIKIKCREKVLDIKLVKIIQQRKGDEWMSKPFVDRRRDDFVVIHEGKWYRFPTPDEAWEFYYEYKGR